MQNVISKRKFTLIELLIVVGIMGLLLTISLPQFGKLLAGNNLNKAISDIDIAINQARNHAVVNREKTVVKFHMEGTKAYYLAYYTTKENGTQKDLSLFTGEEIDDTTNFIDFGTKIKGKIEFSVPDSDLEFRASSGMLSKPTTGDFTLTIKDNKTLVSKDITVNRYTGKVKIELTQVAAP